MPDSNLAAELVSGCGVIITALLTTMTAIRNGRDKRERETDRRKLEEETTDAILARVNRELKRAYRVIDRKDRQIRQFIVWADTNRDTFAGLGIKVPDFYLDDDDGDLESGIQL